MWQQVRGGVLSCTAFRLERVDPCYSGSSLASVGGGVWLSPAKDPLALWRNVLTRSGWTKTKVALLWGGRGGP